MANKVQVSAEPAFEFFDLFAGIGGFHAALAGFGGECAYAVEIDEHAARVYKDNWGKDPLGNILKDAYEDISPTGEVTLKVSPKIPQRGSVPQVLVAGFPCQPFSKSGMQRGVEETRGTLFRNIFVLIEERKPALVILENVRNLIGPKHRKDYDLIIALLRDAGYRVSTEPSVISPHLLPPNSGGRPQSRDRVFITATYVGENQDAIFDESIKPVFPSKAKSSWHPENWSLERDLNLEEGNRITKLRLSEEENRWIDAWGEFVKRVRADMPGLKLPGFPIWVDAFVHPDDLIIPEETPEWKADFLKKNSEFYKSHRKTLDKWMTEFQLSSFPQSRRKFEWQAQDAASIDETIMHFRPSGIRVKKATYVPALVAITQTSIIAKTRRRLSTTETANLQGLPSWFDFGTQTDALTYKQLGNGVNVGVVWQVVKRHVERDAEFIRELYPTLFEAIILSPESPESRINSLRRGKLLRKLTN